MHDRDAILSAVDLEQLADELLGGHAGSDRHPTWTCPNPNHTQTGRTPPVNVFLTRWGEQRWRCHGCGEGGSAIDLVMACRGVGPGPAFDELAERAGESAEASTPRRDHRQPAVGCQDPEGLTRYVRACAEALWRPDGRAIQKWLTEERGLPEDVLRRNLVGADLGQRRQERPDGMPRAGGAVLPAVMGEEATYAQARVLHPRGDGPRYLNPSADLARNPRLARFRPVEVDHAEVIVTEGVIDALSANAMGYRSVAVLSAGYPDLAVARQLARINRPLVVAFDADDAGQAGADQLVALLSGNRRPAGRMDLQSGDMNDHLRADPAGLQAAVRASTLGGSQDHGRSLS